MKILFKNKNKYLIFVFKRPIRSIKKAFEYWKPRRITLREKIPIYAWLWWNMAYGFGSFFYR